MFGFQVVCVLAALAFLIWQSWQFLRGIATRSWRRTTGTIRRVDAGESQWVDTNGLPHCSFSPKVEYAYQIGTRSFVSTRIGFVPTMNLSEAAATRLLDGLSEGAQVDVYYHPRQWAQSVLICGASSGNVARLAIAVVLLVLVVVLSLANPPAGTR